MPQFLLYIRSKCFLDFLIEEAARHNFSEILLLAGYFGGQIKERPVTPADLAATIYHHMGVPLDATYQDDRGRPHFIVQENGQPIRELITVNGVRVVLQDGTWGLVRASSNKPELVIVCESPTAEDNMKAMFKNIDMHLSGYEAVGEYNQKI